MEQLIFATFSIKLSSRSKDYETLSYFNNGDDLLDYIQGFFDDIYSGNIKTEEFKGKKKFHIRTDKPGYRSEPDRCYYGLMSSGVSGDTYKIINLETNKKKADVGADDGAFKDVFFFFYIPKNRQTGFLVLQRKGNFGVKVALENSLKKYLRSRELKYVFRMYNLVSGGVYETMMTNGVLKRIDLIKNKIPSDLETYMKNGKEPTRIKGKLKTTIEHKEHLPDNWKGYLNRLFKRKRSKDANSQFYELEDIDDQYEEIEFQLEYNGKKKTFFIVNKWRTQPDIDVTREYREKYGNEIIIHNLALLAKSTIMDVYDIEEKING